MEQFLFWFGGICAGLISIGFAMYGIACYQSVKSENYYDGLKGRIADTVTSISEHAKVGDMYSPDDLKIILISLRKGYWPDVCPTYTKPDEDKAAP